MMSSVDYINQVLAPLKDFDQTIIKTALKFGKNIQLISMVNLYTQSKSDNRTLTLDIYCNHHSNNLDFQTTFHDIAPLNNISLLDRIPADISTEFTKQSRKTKVFGVDNSNKHIYKCMERDVYLYTFLVSRLAGIEGVFVTHYYICNGSKISWDEDNRTLYIKCSPELTDALNQVPVYVEQNLGEFGGKRDVIHLKDDKSKDEKILQDIFFNC